jgi:hypothetical protein
MRKSGLRTAVRHEDFDSWRWYLVAVMGCCWGWLFYLLYVALR